MRDFSDTSSSRFEPDAGSLLEPAFDSRSGNGVTIASEPQSDLPPPIAEAALAVPAVAAKRCTCGRFDLQRFVRAQAGIYGSALAELRGGEKRSHWMWFIFPQVLGLGNSHNARLFAIDGLEEAKAYAAHPLLGPRLEEATSAALEWAGRRSALETFGVIDAMKFHSSMTLFEQACPDNSCFPEALKAFYNGQRDQATLDQLAQ